MKNISVAFDSKIIVFFATLSLCLVLFVVFLLNQNLSSNFKNNKEVSLVPKISASGNSGLIKQCFESLGSGSDEFRDDAPWS